MAESTRNTDPNAPQNPPRSLLNKEVRRSALWTYLTPLVLFFAGVAIILAYWGSSPPARNVEEPRGVGTSGTEREPAGEETPGGHNPDRAASKPQRELEHRGGRVITELGEMFEDNSRDTIGRRIEIRDVDVERVESETLFWIRDGNVRTAVAAPNGAAVTAGQSVNVIGTVERSGDEVRIRASRVEPSQ